MKSQKSVQLNRFYWSIRLKIRQCLLAHLVTSSSLWFSGGLLMSRWKVISWYKTLSLCNNNFIEHLWGQAFMSSMAAWFYIFPLTKWHMLLETNTESRGTSSQTCQATWWHQAMLVHTKVLSLKVKTMSQHQSFAVNAQLALFFKDHGYLHAFCITKLAEADLEERQLYISLRQSTSILLGAVEIVQKPSFHFHGCIYMLSWSLPLWVISGALSPEIKQR